MSDSVDELIREIAAKHSIALSRDDPILVLQTINNRLLQDSAKVQQAQLEQFKSELEALCLRWGMDAKDKAERIVNASLAASKDAAAQIVHESAQKSSAAVRKDIEATLEGVMTQVRTARWVALMHLVAAGMTFIAALLAVWATRG